MLRRAHLEEADLRGAHLEGADLSKAHLEGADLRKAQFDESSRLDEVILTSRRYGTAALGDVRWGGADLTVVDWRQVRRLGDEDAGRYGWKPPASNANPFPKVNTGKQTPSSAHRRPLTKRARVLLSGFNPDLLRMWVALGALWLVAAWESWRLLEVHLDAARAYRRLAPALREQGIADEADYFAYQAQVCQRRVFLRRLRLLRWLLSWALAALAGYGYKPLRAVGWYIVVIAGFAYAYFQATHGVLTFGVGKTHIQPLQWYEAVVLSVSSFHGRGFFQPLDYLGDPVAILAAAEAVFGLFIEISFIATFTQRFFAR